MAERQHELITKILPEIAVCDLVVLENICLKVVEAYPDATVIIDRKGTILVFNTSAELMFDCAREDVIGKPVEILMPEARRIAHVAHRNEYFQDPRVREMGSLNMTLEGLRRDGSTFAVLVKLAPVVVQTSGVFFLAVVRRVKP